MEPNLLMNTKLVYGEELYKDDIKAINDAIEIIAGTTITPKLKQFILHELNIGKQTFMECHAVISKDIKNPKIKIFTE